MELLPSVACAGRTSAERAYPITTSTTTRIRCRQNRSHEDHHMAQEWKAKRSALLGRTDFVGGDFFDAATLPAPAAGSRDVYMLRNVLHDWNDAKTLHILRSLRTNMGAPHDLFPELLRLMRSGGKFTNMCTDTITLQVRVMQAPRRLRRWRWWRSYRTAT